MTHKEVLEMLFKDMRDSLSDYYKSEAKLSEQGDGFYDKHYFDEIQAKYSAWQQAHNKFHSYAAVLRQQGILQSVLEG